MIERLATDLRREFPSMTGQEQSIAQQPVGQMPWGAIDRSKIETEQFRNRSGHDGLARERSRLE